MLLPAKEDALVVAAIIVQDVEWNVLAHVIQYAITIVVVRALGQAADPTNLSLL